MKQKKATKYDVRFLLGNTGTVSMRHSVETNKSTAMQIARIESKKDNGRLYFVLQIQTVLIFKIGKSE